MHGTAHGVGSFLSVHENLGGGLVENMIMSNEPGYYEPGNCYQLDRNLLSLVFSLVISHCSTISQSQLSEKRWLFYIHIHITRSN